MLKTLASTLGLLAVTVTAQTTTPLPPDTNYNVRESHENPIYINIPVPTSLLAPLVPAPLSVDEYGGTGWISVIIDNFNKLELWVPLPTWLNPDGGAFVNSGTSGFQTKIEIAVFDAERNTHGYMIHGIDFQTGASGVIRSLGAQIQQKIPSHVCDFDVDLTNYPARVPLSYACGFDDSYVRGTAAAAGGQARARSRSQHTLKAVTAADTDVNPALAAVTPDPAFVKFIGNRVVKYVKQFDGTVVTSLETGPGSYYNFDSFTWLVDADNTTGIDSNFVQQRFPSLYAGGVTAESPCATHGRCFTVPKVVLVDHKDQPR